MVTENVERGSPEIYERSNCKQIFRIVTCIRKIRGVLGKDTCNMYKREIISVLVAIYIFTVTRDFVQIVDDSWNIILREIDKVSYHFIIRILRSLVDRVS